MPWFQGTFHCHTSNSDGKATPLEVARYYKALKMSFIAISDHNRLTGLEEIQPVLARDFIGIPCSEYSGAEHCHVLGVDVTSAVAPVDEQAGLDSRAILQDGVDRVRGAGGVPVLCHPGWYWAYDHTTILRLKHVTHFEVLNTHPACNTYPIAGVSYPEEIWDRVLTSGARVFGVASDDAHWYADAGSRGCGVRRIALGGTAWNVINADSLDRKCIREAFEAGHFYATSGIRLAEYRATAERISVRAEPWASARVAIDFVGRNGRLLDRTIALEAAYPIKGDEEYVRVRLADTSGCFAFTQPVFIDRIERDGAWTLKD